MTHHTEAVVADKSKSFTYTGNPGYLFPGIGVLSPGDVVKLTDDQVVAVGDEFQPVKGTTAASAADTEGAKP